MQASPQAEESRQPAQETARPESSWLLMDLYICLAGFIVALAGTPQLYVKMRCVMQTTGCALLERHWAGMLITSKQSLSIPPNSQHGNACKLVTISDYTWNILHLVDLSIDALSCMCQETPLYAMYGTIILYNYDHYSIQQYELYELLQSWWWVCTSTMSAEQAGRRPGVSHVTTVIASGFVDETH